ncbi:response regulator transcription factor [bacterium]|nr:response regulator transcription factor [bacterium]
MSKIRVLIVEDHPMFRQAVALALSKSENVEIVAEADNGRLGVKMTEELKPDVVLMDIGLPELDGIEATELIKKSGSDAKVLIFTSREAGDDVFEALSAGADGYITKGANEQQLMSAITAVNEGTAWLDPSIARLVLSNVQQQKQTVVAPQEEKQPQKQTKNTFGLTERELDVLALIVDGMSNSDIADKLVITLSTVKTHVHSILQKLYVANRTQATITAVKEGLV